MNLDNVIVRLALKMKPDQEDLLSYKRSNVTVSLFVDLLSASYVRILPSLDIITRSLQLMLLCISSVATDVV